MDHCKLYADKPEDFYFRQMRSRGVRGVWFRARQSFVANLVRKYDKGGIILDIGCGNSLWNVDGCPVAGIDICEGMLRRNKKECAAFYPVKADFSKGLPVKSESVDLVVVTEILEHMIDQSALVSEIHRILKKDGAVIVSVPHEEWPGLWGGLFTVWCFYKAWRYNDEYYRYRCGHVVRFGPVKLRQVFADFVHVEQKSLGLLTMFFVAQKREARS